MQNIHAQKILVLDFGSQYTQLIARRLREIGVYCEIYACDAPAELIQAFNPNGIILSGGPATVTAENTHRAPECVFNLECPVLGICYGMQTMAAQFSGTVSQSDKREFGYAQINVHDQNPLFAHCDLNNGVTDVWMSHGDHVSELPEGFTCIASTDNAPIAAMANLDKQFYGLQFHPEVTHTQEGMAMLTAFVKDICGCECIWTPDNIIEQSIADIREQVGTDKVILGLSGGVDSSVVAALLHKAIGDQLQCVFVDNGLLRLGEAEQVQTTFEEHFGMNLTVVDAADLFLEALHGAMDPEQKRKIIGKTFIDIFEHQSKQHNDIQFLAQGTIYPDVIESAASKTGKAEVIKSHHNVGGLPDTMKLKLIEPLRELFKDEVRRVGLTLGLPPELINRHPFPGPGLGVRILGEVKQEYADILRQADAIFIEELYKHNLYEKVSQAFAVFLPVKSVGVKGDARHYDYVVALRAVETIDFMTARWAHLPYEFLGLVADRIMNEVTRITRVTYDISGKPPSTIEWE